MPKKIRIVEDHKDIGDAISDFIRFVFSDWEISRCTHGADAIAQTLKDPPDVMILDIVLADEINGLEVVKRLWEGGLRQKPKILVITALGNKAFRGPRVGRPWVEQLTEEERTMVTAFFEKPYGWNAFLTAVAKAAGIAPPDKINLIPENE